MALFRRRQQRTLLPQMPVRYHSIVAWSKVGVSAAVVEMSSGAAQLVGAATVPLHGISRTAHPDVERWHAACDRALTQAEDMTAQTCGHKIVPDYVVMSVPGEVTRSVDVSVAQRRSEPGSSIGVAEVQGVLQRGYRKAQDIVGPRTGAQPVDIVHGSLSRLAVDGQEVVDLLGMRGGEVEVRMSFAVAPLEWLRALEIITKRLELHLVGIVPDHAVLASPLGDPKALLMVLDAEHTAICLVERGRTLWSVIADGGERDILWEIGQEMRLTGRNVELLLRAYREGRLKREVETAVVAAYWRALRLWMTRTAREVRAVASPAPGPWPRGEHPLPHRLYVLDATRRVPEALPCLETPFWERLLSFDACPEIIAYDASLVHDVLDCTTQAAGPAYVPVRALAHYVAQLYRTEHELGRSLTTYVRRQLDGH